LRRSGLARYAPAKHNERKPSRHDRTNIGKQGGGGSDDAAARTMAHPSKISEAPPIYAHSLQFYLVRRNPVYLFRTCRASGR
jgi:hypothetical protein